MADLVLDPDANGGQLARRAREIAPGVYAEEVVLAQPLLGAQAMPVTAATPVAANVAGGSLAVAGQVFTVPAGRTWRGTLVLALSASAAIGAAASVQTATLSVAGAGVTPPAGPLLEVAVALPATVATAPAGARGEQSASCPGVVIVAGSAPATVSLAVSAGATAVRATARGELL